MLLSYCLPSPPLKKKPDLPTQVSCLLLAVLLYGCESWCLTAKSVRLLSNWHNKQIREMCRVAMCQTLVHRITSECLQKRTGFFSLEHYLASRTLLWAGDVARMPKNRLPKRLVFSCIRERNVSGSQEITYGRSLQRHLNHFDLPAVLTEWDQDLFLR